MISIILKKGVKTYLMAHQNCLFFLTTFSYLHMYSVFSIGCAVSVNMSIIVSDVLVMTQE